MFALKRLSLAVATAGTFALAACGDSLSPDTVDPQLLSSNVSTLATTFDNNAAFQSMATLSSSFPKYAAVGLVRAAMPMVSGSVSTGAGARRLMLSLMSPDDIHVLFPSNVLGKTLVWDTDSAGYVVSSLSGAPANGIRLILYVANPQTGQPFVPLQPIGNLDLTDESAPAYNQLGVVLRLGGLTLADYDIRATLATTSATLSALGYIRNSDGSQQVNFDLKGSISLTQGASLDFTINGSDGTQLRLIATASGPSTTIQMSVSRDRNTIHIGVTETNGTVSGSIQFNGTVVADISGPEDNPVITPRDGFGLTQADVTSLVLLFLRLGEFFGDFSDGIFAPAGIVFNTTIQLG